MKNTFLISYSANNDKGTINGNINIENTKTRFSISDIDAVREIIEKTVPGVKHNSVVILFIYFLRPET